MKLLRQQYSFIQSCRSALFQYFETISPEHRVERMDAFGNKSMHGLLVHVAETYLFWISEFALKNPPRATSVSPADIKEIRELFAVVDSRVLEFTKVFEASLEREIKGSIGQNQQEIIVSALKLFTHVTTHEFHHKGQILYISRMLGYTPVDTDIIRF